MNADLGLFVLRATVGTIVMAHGLLKFGVVGNGRTIGSVGGSFDRMGLRPGIFWALVAGLAESLGGILMILGFGGPIGPAVVAADLLVVTLVAHSPQGFWVRAGKAGVEFPLPLAASAFALALVGPGGWSVDSVLALTFPEWLLPASAAILAPGVLFALLSRALTARAGQG